MTAGLRRPTPHGCGQSRITIENRRTNRHVSWMKVDRNGERLNALPKRQVPGVIQIHAIGMAVDERALEAELLDAPFELFHGGLRLLHRQVRKPRITRRMLGDLACQEVIDPASLAHRSGTVALNLNAG